MVQLKPHVDAADRERKAQEKEVGEHEKAVAVKDRLVEELKEINDAEEQLKQTEQEIQETDSKLASHEEECPRFLGLVPTKEQVERLLQKLEARAKQTKENLSRIAQGENQLQVSARRL